MSDPKAQTASPALARVVIVAHHAVDSAVQVANDAVESLGVLGVKGEQVAATGAGYLRGHPILALGLAAAAGYVLGRLMALR